jgi:hypothetical protein
MERCEYFCLFLYYRLTHSCPKIYRMPMNRATNDRRPLQLMHGDEYRYDPLRPYQKIGVGQCDTNTCSSNTGHGLHTVLLNTVRWVSTHRIEDYSGCTQRMGHL